MFGSITHLPYSRVAEEHVLRSSTQPLYLLGSFNLGGSAAINRSPSSPKKNVKGVVFLLSTPNAENCESNCNNILTPTSSRCNIRRSREPIIFLALHTPPTHERDAKFLRQRLVLPLPDHERVASYAYLAIRLVCNSQNGLLTFTECSKTTHLYTTHRAFFIRQDGRTPKWLWYFNWCIETL